MLYSGWASGVDRLSARPLAGQTPIVGVGPNSTRPSLSVFPYFLESHGPYGGNWIYNRGHRDYISEAVMAVAPANEAEDSCLGLCQIHGTFFQVTNLICAL